MFRSMTNKKDVKRKSETISQKTETSRDYSTNKPQRSNKTTPK